MTSVLSQLHTLAGLYGIKTSYLDMNGRTKEASTDSLLATLKALGAPLAGLPDIPDAITKKRNNYWLEPVEPVVLVTAGEVLSLNLKLPSSLLNTRIQIVLTLENGLVQEFSPRIEETGILQSAAVDEKLYLNLKISLPFQIPAGYHKLVLEISGSINETMVISSPIRSFQPPRNEKIWGLFAPLYALHSNRSWGAGDFSDLNRILDWTTRQGGKLIGTLPLLSVFFNHEYGPGPYLPASRLFWNEFYLDIEQIPELPLCQSCLDILQETEFRNTLETLRLSDYVNYSKQMALKRQVLEKLADYFFQEQPSRFNEFADFVKKEENLLEYASFREAVDIHGLDWSGWPQQAVRSCSSALNQAGPACRYFLFTQWLTEMQINSLARKAKDKQSYLYLDMPVGIHPYSYDVWKENSIFVRQSSAGAPPDPIFTNGQNWNFPPLHPENIRRHGYRYFIDSLRKQLSVAGMLRIDHLMNFQRLYWIPQGIPDREGVYVNYKADEFYAILALESQRYQSVIIGEDLGLVPPEVRPAMEKHGLFRMFIGQYELSSENQLNNAPVQAAASLNTHDMYPFAAFWEEKDIVERQKMNLINAEEALKELEQRREVKRILISILQCKGLTGDLAQDTEAIFRAVLNLLAACPVFALIINVEDLWLSTKPQNVPGTMRKQNWTHKTDYSLEKLEKSKNIRQLLENIDNIRKGDGGTG
jgi:4-alpha-glucanotransferase